MSLTAADGFFLDDVDFLLADFEEVVQLGRQCQFAGWGSRSGAGVKDAVCTHLGSSLYHDGFWRGVVVVVVDGSVAAIGHPHEDGYFGSGRLKQSV